MRALLLCVLICFAPAVCRAHDPGLSSLKIIRTKNRTLIAVATHISKLGVGASTPAIDAAIRRRLRLKLDGETFAPASSRVLRDLARDTVIWQAKYARRATRIGVESRLYPETESSRLAVLIFDDGRLSQQTLLNAEHPFVVFDATNNGIEGASTPAATPLQVIAAYGREGVLHIFGGPDHIAFILGLLLLGGSLKTLLKIVTAFTLAHSITLSLAATGVLTPSPRLIEPLIALSIIAVAVENWRMRRRSQTRSENQKPKDWRPFIAFGFGLIHGFGFAGALSEIGLPREMLGWALAAFNGGVEVGQAAIVLCVAPALGVLSTRKARFHRALVLWGSSGIAAAGAFWFVQRVAGL